MATLASFRQLIVWQKSMALAEQCYALVRTFPADERYELGGQLRRAAISVPSNVAEGQRLTTRGFRAHLRTALGSEAEIETDVELARRLGLVSRIRAEDVIADAQEVARLLHGLRSSLAHSGNRVE